jgi:hypothetical protein
VLKDVEVEVISAMTGLKSSSLLFEGLAAAAWSATAAAALDRVSKQQHTCWSSSSFIMANSC